ncbi:MAG: hypothetical protein JXQ83_08830, partial [Candidatus Glassbacteria bacterium]|nr:hypothetical protein [Candidatus Glassbacteria bacterium]
DSWEGTWILPSNHRELAWAVRQAAGGRLSLEVGAPDWVAVEQVEKQGMVLVHLVNYRLGDVLTDIPVDIRVDAGKKVGRVRVVSPDRPGEQELDFQFEGGRCSFRVPLLEVYDVVMVDLASG